MKEHPILMDTFSVNAIQAGRKTQTRRPIRPQPTAYAHYEFTPSYGEFWKVTREKEFKCPYGLPGDHLWVRETWGVDEHFDNVKPSEMSSHLLVDEVWYHAAQAPVPPWVGKTRPSIHMPRWASRITLEVKGVRMEKVQEISRVEAVKEGWPRLTQAQEMQVEENNGQPIEWFRSLWASIYGASS